MVQCGRRARRGQPGDSYPRTGVKLISDPSQANKDRSGRLLRYLAKRGIGIDRAGACGR